MVAMLAARSEFERHAKDCCEDLAPEQAAPLFRVDWVTLLRRTVDVDVKSCAACMTVRAVVTAIVRDTARQGRPLRDDRHATQQRPASFESTAPHHRRAHALPALRASRPDRGLLADVQLVEERRIVHPPR